MGARRDGGCQCQGRLRNPAVWHGGGEAGRWIPTDLGLHPGPTTRQLCDPAIPHVAVPSSLRPGEQQSLPRGNKCTKGIQHGTPQHRTARNVSA